MPTPVKLRDLAKILKEHNNGRHSPLIYDLAKAMTRLARKTGNLEKEPPNPIELEGEIADLVQNVRNWKAAYDTSYREFTKLSRKTCNLNNEIAQRERRIESLDEQIASKQAELAELTKSKGRTAGKKTKT